MPVERREPIRPGIDPDGEPVSRHLEARAQERRIVRQRKARHDPRCAGREGDLDSLGCVDAAGDLEWRGDPRRDRAHDVHVDRGAPSGTVEVDDVNERRTQAHEVLGDPFGSIGGCADAGRDARPEHDPRAAPLDVDRRDDVHRSATAVRLGPRRRGPPREAPDGGS